MPKHLLPVPTTAMMLIGKKKMDLKAPIFIRIFKLESELEIWKRRKDGRFYHFKTYPICNWSGNLGPKRKKGDKQAPEGFYTVNEEQMNPDTDFHLSFNIGYPNTYDSAHKRTGNFLMVHGRCSSVGCYAMTDPLMEEIFALIREAFNGGQKTVHVHAFPFQMNQVNMHRNAKNPNYSFWKRLKLGYDYFELTRLLPVVEVCEKQYYVNVEWDGTKLNASGLCPEFTRPQLHLFVPTAGEEVLVSHRIVVPGIRKRIFRTKKLNPTKTNAFSKIHTFPQITTVNVNLVSRSDHIAAFINLTLPTAP
ncbi:MAG: murein L,D-transpeptidase [Hyphomicrobiaceae bacterium]|nr:murein L,D-transpeptidase [Hyphomicrobiaceae bacterium]